jgi:hypothetical protein
MSQSTVNSVIDALRRRYAANLPAKVDRAAASVSAVLAGPWNPALGDIAHRMIHSLIGSSGTYGFPELSGVARSAERILRDSVESGKAPAPETVLVLQEIIARLGYLAVMAAEGASARVA